MLGLEGCVSGWPVLSLKEAHLSGCLSGWAGRKHLELAQRQGGLRRSHFMTCLSVRCLARSPALARASVDKTYSHSVRSTGRAGPP